MKANRRFIRLTFVHTGESVRAEMLDDEAPGACTLLWDRLPLEENIIHGQYSGAEVFVKIADPRAAPRENLTQIPLPGELFYFYDSGENVTSGNRPMAEVCFVYGRGVILKGPEGAPTYASLVARVPGDWKYDWPDFAMACRRARFEGPQRLRIEREEP